MCFAFTTTEQQLTARSYPSNDLTPPAMTMLVDRGSEKRTGIKSRRMPKAAMGGMDPSCKWKRWTESKLFSTCV